MDWLKIPYPVAEKKQPDEVPISSSCDEEVETIIRQIEEKQVDITSTYDSWRNVGFAFTDKFGENGREFYHRVSRFYPNYSPSTCDRQYDSCLKSRGTGISIKTFFHLAKEAGVYIRKQKTISEPDLVQLPNLPDSIFPELPMILQKVVEPSASKEDRDILLLGALTTISSSLPNIYGIYDCRKVSSNLYLFITAQASAGKGRLGYCKQIVQPIHKYLREQTELLKVQYEVEMTECNGKKGAIKPCKPLEKMLIIPANSSSTGIFQLLSDNEGTGLIFETEGDTLSQTLKSDYGNYSDGLRKAFHHEPISYFRRTEKEFVEIEHPCLSVLLSGTPKQVAALVPSAENGLFSRFIFYAMKVRPEWKDVFASNSDNGLNEHYSDLGSEFYELYKTLMKSSGIQICLTTDQKKRFNDHFNQLQKDYLALKGMGFMGTVRRLGLITFRICMILSALRILETGNTSVRIVCEKQDFNAALLIAEVLVKHALHVYSNLPEDTRLFTQKSIKEKFLETLPLAFNRKTYLQIAQELSINMKTAERYVTIFCKSGHIHREKQDHYTKSVS